MIVSFMTDLALREFFTGAAFDKTEARLQDVYLSVVVYIIY